MQLVEALFSYNDDDDKKGIMLLHAIMTLLMNAAMQTHKSGCTSLILFKLS
jgi:hypothetical protein